MFIDITQVVISMGRSWTIGFYLPHGDGVLCCLKWFRRLVVLWQRLEEIA